MELTATIFLLFFIFNVVVPSSYAQQHSTVTSTEIRALTSFKRSIFHDPLGALDGWDASTPSAPCDWRGIVCYNNRVRELRLPRLQLGGQLTDQLSNLRELRKLSLHFNNFNGSIPDTLSQCVLLRAVYLQYNSFSGNFPPSVFNLTNLLVLNVAHNYLSGKIAASIQCSLQYLDLSSNDFSGELPLNFSEQSQLQLINFSYNRFSGEIPASIGKLQQLEYLWLDSNQLYGTLPSAIANCSSLMHLSAEDNKLKGIIPGSIGAVLLNLQVLALSRNRFSGAVPKSIFCRSSGNNTPSLRIVQLAFNEFTEVVKPQNNGSCKAVLEVLDLHVNRIHGDFPTWLTSLTTLRILDVSGNFFKGLLPVEINNLFNLEELRVANNSLTGSIPSQLLQCSLLKVVDFEGNRLSGQIPVFLSQMKSLRSISLGRNLFSGSIPYGFGNVSGLEMLNLSGNNFSGKLPEDIMRLSNLTALDLSNNKFSGEIPDGLGDLLSLVVLNLSSCGFTGEIPMSTGNLMKLTSLDLSKQQISGELPIELFGLPNLQVVALQENKLSGDVPEGFSNLVDLHYLNLSSNEFTGRIPSNYGLLESLVVLSVSFNRVSGMIPLELGNCSDLQVLQLRSNRLRGNIPGDISRLSRLEVLDLGLNNLDGEIPDEISRISSMTTLLLDGNHLSDNIPGSLSILSNLTALNLSSNRLNGSIPSSLSNMFSLKYLNLSRNYLEGKIPNALSSRFDDPYVFSMNKLCGKPLNKECANVRNRKRRKLILLIVIAVSGACLVALFCCGYIYSLLRWRKRLGEWATGEKKRNSASASSGVDRSRGSGENGGPKLVMFNNKITLAETLEATRQFDEENVMSRGRYGLVFKATYQDGTVLSIRRLVDGSIDEGTFRKEAETLGKVKHRNITVLRGYYAGPPDLRLLVYDYMPNGNLATLLQEANHQDGHMLNWPMRHLIALGIARGLAFLHSLSIFHGDIKPQNVLFDADFEAHISEFGLERLTIATPAEASSSSTPVGSLGYIAPEASLTGQPSKEADIYSFGIVVLEILTGRKPVMFTQDEDIVKWVKNQLQKGQISELLEPGLVELDPESSEWEEFLLGVKVGLLCTATDPIDRPSMADIVFMLEGCRVGPEIPSSANPTSLPSPI